MGFVSVLSVIETIVGIIIGPLQFLYRVVFWQNKKILYLNDNKENSDKSLIAKLKKDFDGRKIIHITKNEFWLKHPNIQLLCMKYNLLHIKRNTRTMSDFYYGGFVSVPFAVLDGYQIGGQINPTLIDRTKNGEKGNTKGYYEIDFSHDRKDNYKYELSNCENVNLVISSSFEIKEKSLVSKYPTYDLGIAKIVDKVDKKYLNEVYYRVTDFMDAAMSCGVKNVYIYCASRQCVSFVIGTAIKNNHPNVYVYEFQNGVYSWLLDVKNKKILKREDISNV